MRHASCLKACPETRGERLNVFLHSVEPYGYIEGDLSIIRTHWGPWRIEGPRWQRWGHVLFHVCEVPWEGSCFNYDMTAWFMPHFLLPGVITNVPRDMLMCQALLLVMPCHAGWLNMHMNSIQHLQDSVFGWMWISSNYRTGWVLVVLLTTLWARKQNTPVTVRLAGLMTKDWFTFQFSIFL